MCCWLSGMFQGRFPSKGKAAAKLSVKLLSRDDSEVWVSKEALEVKLLFGEISGVLSCLNLRLAFPLPPMAL